MKVLILTKNILSLQINFHSGMEWTTWQDHGGRFWMTCTALISLCTGSSKGQEIWYGSTQALYTGFKPWAGATILLGMWDLSIVSNLHTNLLTFLFIVEKMYQSL